MAVLLLKTECRYRNSRSLEFMVARYKRIEWRSRTAEQTSVNSTHQHVRR